MMHAEVSGYVLAGGKSSRMGRDKALLDFAGEPLALRAVSKLRMVCADVHILSSRVELEAFAPLVSDVHPGCGPLGGMEAALLHTSREWCLFLAVDMPFVPAGFLSEWVQEIVADGVVRVAMFTVHGVPQPTLCMVHRELMPAVQRAMEGGEYKVFPVLETGARELARTTGRSSETVLVNRAEVHDAWFANLNTPEEYTAAERGWNVDKPDRDCAFTGERSSSGKILT